MNRYFIALPIPSEIKSKITEFITSHPGLKLEWENTENLHLTLIPTKELDQQQLETWVDKCSKYLAEGVFAIGFKTITMGPTLEDPRLIWVTADSFLQLSELKTGLEQVLGYNPDHPQFIPHITLGRIPHQDQIDPTIKHFQERVHWSMKVDRFAIFQSEQKNGSHQYTIIQEFPI